jgi:signal transduction histidine kinase/DNA-binding NarL/FixJ family response regulator
MRRLRRPTIGLIFVTALALALFAVNHLGLTLKRQAIESWLQRANEESQRITDISLGWLSLFHAQLRGLAALFFGSTEVTKDEFLNALDLIEGAELEAMIPLTSVAFSEQRLPGNPDLAIPVRDCLFPVTLSSDIHPPLSHGQDLAEHPQIFAAILSALDHAGRVIMGPVFRGPNDQLFTCLALAAHNGGKPGVLVSVVNLSEFLADLDILHIPDGLNLRIIEFDTASDAGRAVVCGDWAPPFRTVATAYFPTQSGLARWDYYWDVTPQYQGGAAILLGQVVQYGGNVLVLSVFAVVAILLLQNLQVNRLVARRTAQLTEATRVAEAANRAKSVFLANMSHELRTPLNAVLGFSRRLAEDTKITSHQMRSLEIISHSGEHLLNLINSVLEISKIESGRMELEETTIDLHQLVQEIRSLMHIRAQDKGLSFTMEQSRDLPRCIAVDSGKLRQVLINLVGNAIRYTRTGGVILRGRIAAWDGGSKARLRFEVEDTGPGICNDDRKRIFMPFERLKDRSPAETGTGLGLAISRQYVQLMGGQIDVRSEPEKGSLFHFEIPARVVTVQDIQEESRYRAVIGLAEGQPAYRLLIAEDQAENRLLLRILLEPLGFQLREAENGKLAVAICQQWRPHLIFMDIRMPVMDGLEATRRIKANEAGADVRIVAVTAHALEEERIEILNAGCDDFIRKPYQDGEIFESLAKHLGVRFIFGPETVLPAAANPDATALAALPAESVKQLKQALLGLDIHAISNAIDSIRLCNARLAEALAAMAREYQYGRILALIEGGREESKKGKSS